MDANWVETVAMIVDFTAFLLCLAMTGWGLLALRRKDPAASDRQSGQPLADFDQLIARHDLAQNIDQVFMAVYQAIESEHQRFRENMEQAPPTVDEAVPEPPAPAASAPPAPQQALSDQEKILQLSADGMGPAEIAREVGVPLGEVALVVKLDSERQKSQRS